MVNKKKKMMITLPLSWSADCILPNALTDLSIFPYLSLFPWYSLCVTKQWDLGAVESEAESPILLIRWAKQNEYVNCT